jgi:midasin
MPYFEDEFEGLCQFVDALESSRADQEDVSETLQLVRAKSSTLARRPTKSLAAVISYTPSNVLQSLYRLAALGGPVGREMVLQGRLHIATLNKM